ncbi:unnamed protein product [Malus baccata var. baccata]
MKFRGTYLTELTESAVRALNSIFEQWDTQAMSGLWNISGEPCSGSAINSTEFEVFNNGPAIYCNCSYDNNATCHITKLSIGINSFSGPIPKELGNLKELTLLAFGSNNFSGTLPPELGNLVKLEQIYMDSCGLSGEIPSTFAKLTNMQTLRFQGNSFEGPIPTSFSQLTSLTSLKLSPVGDHNIATSSWIELPPEKFSMQSKSPNM